jgi:DHA2 family multidrug resistance protein
MERRPPWGEVLTRAKPTFPDASFGYFARARVYQMLGLPFLFIPITTGRDLIHPRAPTRSGPMLRIPPNRLA